MFRKLFNRDDKAKKASQARQQFADVSFSSRNKASVVKRYHRCRRCLICGYYANTYAHELPLCTYHEGYDDRGKLVVMV